MRSLMVISLVAFAAWSLTEALSAAWPDLTTRQRWAAIFWVASAAGALHMAWTLAAP